MLLEVSDRAPTLQVKAGVRCDKSISLSAVTCFSPADSAGAVETSFYFLVYYLVFIPVKHFVCEKCPIKILYLLNRVPLVLIKIIKLN